MRFFPVLAIVAVLATGCDTAAPALAPPPPQPAPSISSAPQPRGPERLATWEQVGGYLPDAAPLDVAHVVVYTDGLAIIDGERALHLSPLEITQLRSSLEWNLSGMPGRIESVGGSATDGATNRLTARATSGALLKVAVDGMVNHSKVPARVRDAFARLELLIGQTGTDYAAERVCAVWTSPSSQGAASSWPVGVPVPSDSPELQRLTGAQAHALAEAASLAAPHAVARLRTAAGAEWLVQWRYLLPDEPRPSGDSRTCAG